MPGRQKRRKRRGANWPIVMFFRVLVLFSSFAFGFVPNSAVRCGRASSSLSALTFLIGLSLKITNPFLFLRAGAAAAPTKRACTAAQTLLQRATMRCLPLSYSNHQQHDAPFLSITHMQYGTLTLSINPSHPLPPLSHSLFLLKILLNPTSNTHTPIHPPPYIHRRSSNGSHLSKLVNEDLGIPFLNGIFAPNLSVAPGESL